MLIKKGNELYVLSRLRLRFARRLPRVMNVLTVNLLLNTLIFWIVARQYLLPRLERVDPTTVLVPVLLLHSTRHLGLMFLASGATHPGIPAQFSYPAAFGDLVAAVFALVALFAVKRNLRSARAAVWVFNVAGTLDLLLAITLATIYDAQPYMSAAYWIPAFWVPALLVTHAVTFVILSKPWPRVTKAA